MRRVLLSKRRRLVLIAWWLLCCRPPARTSWPRQPWREGWRLGGGEAKLLLSADECTLVRTGERVCELLCERSGKASSKEQWTVS